jgi:DNA polymerase V
MFAFGSPIYAILVSRVKHYSSDKMAVIRSEISELYKYQDGMRLDIPFFASPIKAGFPSPAEDYIENRIDLNRDLIKNPDSTFYGRAASDSMEPLIYTGSMLIIDRAAETCHGDIILAHISGEFCMKRLSITDKGMRLVSENPNYQPIRITGEMDFSVWGKIIHSIQSF